MNARVLLACMLFALPLMAAEPQSGSAKYFADLHLVDQNGQGVDLYSLFHGRTVVMHTFFATCTASCPILTRTVAAVQERYAERVGKDLVLISITVDPTNDTSEKLKAYARGLSAGAGWYFLTGTKEQVDAALRKIGQYTEARDDHTNILIIGNDRTGLWKKAFGLAKREEILAIVDSVLNDQGK
jgi:protein SCO1/2